MVAIVNSHVTVVNAETGHYLNGLAGPTTACCRERMGTVLRKKGDGVEFARFFCFIIDEIETHTTKSTHGCGPAALHIICRGIERRNIFRDDTGGKRLVDHVAKRLLETVTPCFAWTLIRNRAGKET